MGPPASLPGPFSRLSPPVRLEIAPEGGCGKFPKKMCHLRPDPDTYRVHPNIPFPGRPGSSQGEPGHFFLGPPRPPTGLGRPIPGGSRRKPPRGARRRTRKSAGSRSRPRCRSITGFLHFFSIPRDSSRHKTTLRTTYRYIEKVSPSQGTPGRRKAGRGAFLLGVFPTLFRQAASDSNPGFIFWPAGRKVL